MKSRKTSTKNKALIAKMKKGKGITLIALVVTIVVLLILARSKHCDFNWRQPVC